jgi:hypothetical protein
MRRFGRGDLIWCCRVGNFAVDLPDADVFDRYPKCSRGEEANAWGGAAASGMGGGHGLHLVTLRPA